MIVNLKRPNFARSHSQDYFYKELFQLLLTAKGVWIDIRDVEVSFNEMYKFYDVSIFKCEQTSGCGTKEILDRDWETHKQVIKDFFQVKEYKETYRWVKHHPLRYTKPQNTDIIDGIRFFVPEDTTITI